MFMAFHGILSHSPQDGQQIVFQLRLYRKKKYSTVYTCYNHKSNTKSTK